MTPEAAGPGARFRGALLGLACGDAMGAAVEGAVPENVHPVWDLTGGRGLLPGQWTDDTSLALCLADSLIACGGADPEDQLRRFVRWWQEGERASLGRAFDIGSTTRRALERFRAEGTLTAGPEGDSNGSLMRLAPVPLAYAADVAEAARRSGESSLTTHGGPAAVDGCRLLGALIALAVRGVSKQELLSPAAAAGALERPLAAEIGAIAAGAYRDRHPPQIRAGPRAAATLEAALWAFYHSGPFCGGLFLAVALGGDADTVGAVYGQLAGAHYGEEAIPLPWRQALCRFADLPSIADGLLELFAALSSGR